MDVVGDEQGLCGQNRVRQFPIHLFSQNSTPLVESRIYSDSILHDRAAGVSALFNLSKSLFLCSDATADFLWVSPGFDRTSSKLYNIN